MSDEKSYERRDGVLIVLESGDAKTKSEWKEVAFETGKSKPQELPF